MDTPLAAAQAYAERGWRVLPLHTPQTDGRGKKPRIAQWQKRASTDPHQIASWWSETPDANVGVLTGHASGIVVLDVDVRNGKRGPASLEALEAEHGPLPPTLEAQTGGGGRHLFFRHPGGRVGNRAGVRPGLDVRGDGGQVVVPPSVHSSGRRYVFTSDTEVAELPTWFLREIQGQSTNGAPPARGEGSAIPHGCRNNTLTRIAGAMRGHGCTTESIEAGLQVENRDRCQPPLPAAEVSGIASSIGGKAPRQTFSNGGTFWDRDLIRELLPLPNHHRLLMHLVTEACWEPRIDGAVLLGEGEVRTSLRKIGKACSWEHNNATKEWGPSRVTELLEDLAEQGRVEILEREPRTHLKVANYKQYQAFPMLR